MDLLSPSQVLEVYGRQADELAAMVESALREEHLQHAEQLRVLDEHRRIPVDEQRRVLIAQHERRAALLRVLAHALGEANAQLDEVAHQVTTADQGGRAGR
ncbi:hypothetical protein ACU61A_41000 [Pseudonocardia sichuanensis]